MNPTTAAGTKTLRLGRPVRSRDDKWIGRVERLVFVPESRTLKEFVLHRGLIRARDWFVARSYIDQIDQDGTVILRLSASEIDGLPNYLKARYVEVLPTLLSAAGLPNLWRLQGSVPLDAVTFDRHSRIEDCNGRRIGALCGITFSDAGYVFALEMSYNYRAQCVVSVPMEAVTLVRSDRIRLSWREEDKGGCTRD